MTAAHPAPHKHGEAFSIPLKLPHSYQRMLRIWADHQPKTAARAESALRLLLDDLLRSTNPAALHASSLTRLRCPFEPAFASWAPGIRYTVDPAPPEIPAINRLDYALALLTKLGVKAPAQTRLQPLRSFQTRGNLSFGAHLGARHTAATDNYKLYVEIPSEAVLEANTWADDLLGSSAILTDPDRNARPVLAGFDLASSSLEVYYRIENMHPLEIATLLGRTCMSDRAPELLSTLTRSQRWPHSHRLPGQTWGFSYSRQVDGSIIFSLYTFTGTLFGPDGWARESILRLADEQDWCLDDYKEASRPLANSRALPGHHGILGLMIAPDAELAAWVGLSPPEEANAR
jgi:hypothetical protein